MNVKRYLSDDLRRWKDSPARKPLLIKGVRQCGKTWLLKEFGRECYNDAAYFNFEGNAALSARFWGDLDVRRIISELGILRQQAIAPGETLVVFDEIQFCNQALTSLKYFCENAPEYHVVCAGSLLGVALSKPLSFPVGKVDFMTLRPMSFEEFLWANGEEMLCGHLQAMPAHEKVSDLFVERLETYLKNYYIVGGMPEAVQTWLDAKDLQALERVQQSILDSYELDFAKHAPPKDFPKLAAIWRSIPLQLAKENSKFIFSQVKQGWRAKDLEDALEWLLGAGMVHKVTKIEKPFMPLSSYEDQALFKLYLSDVGLLRKMAGLPAAAILEKSDTFREFKGALAENYVLCELLHSVEQSPFFWRSGNTAEVDFILQHGLDIVPLEVKSERNDKAKSLAEYRKKYSPRVAVKITMQNVGGGDVRKVPLYLLWQLEKYLA
jgi:predicted AAA+ superfamily ATPase